MKCPSKSIDRQAANDSFQNSVMNAAPADTLALASASPLPPSMQESASGVPLQKSSHVGGITQARMLLCEQGRTEILKGDLSVCELHKRPEPVALSCLVPIPLVLVQYLHVINRMLRLPPMPRCCAIVCGCLLTQRLPVEQVAGLLQLGQQVCGAGVGHKLVRAWAGGSWPSRSGRRRRRR